MLKVSNDTLGKHPRNSSKDVPLLHSLINQFEEWGKDPSGKPYLNLWNSHTHTPFSRFSSSPPQYWPATRDKRFSWLPPLFKFFHLNLYCLSMFFWQTPRWLPSWDHIWIHIQPVTYKLGINLEYLISTLGEHIDVVFQKLHQCCFLQGWQLRPYLKVFLLILTDQNPFQFLGQYLMW